MRFSRLFVVAFGINGRALGLDYLGKAQAAPAARMNHKAVIQRKFILGDAEALAGDFVELPSRIHPGLVGGIAVNSSRSAAADAAVARHRARIEVFEFELTWGDF